MSDEENKMLEIFKKEVEKEQNEYEQVNEYTKFYYNNHKFILNLIEKQSKEIEELKKENLEIRDWKYVIDSPIDLDKLKELDLIKIKGKEYVSKDKIKEILEIEEKIDNEKLLSLLQTIVDENARLEDIEDRKVQIEYNNVFNKGVKSVEDKIKAKIEEVKDGTYDAKIVLESLLEKE